MELGSINIAPENFSLIAGILGFITSLLVIFLFMGVKKTFIIPFLSFEKNIKIEPNTNLYTNLNSKPKPSKHVRKRDEGFKLVFITQK